MGITSDRTIYVGTIVIILAVAGVIFLNKKERIFWLSLARNRIHFFSRPNLHISGNEYNFWMPYRILERIPILNIIRAAE